MEDGDYIDEDIWRAWAANTSARLEAATRENNVVAFARLNELGPAEWWLEGVRVASEQRGQGIGRALLAHMIDLFSESGFGCSGSQPAARTRS